MGRITATIALMKKLRLMRTSEVVAFVDYLSEKPISRNVHAALSMALTELKCRNPKAYRRWLKSSLTSPAVFYR